MNLKSITIFNSLIVIASAAVGNINDFSKYPGIVDLIQANTKDYKTNFKYTFLDGPIYSGDGTAYGDATSRGNCLFPKEEYYEDMMYAALNNEQYNFDMGCGLCAVVVSTSNPYNVIRIRVIDQCPECEHGSLDFSDKAFKALSGMDPARIKITWAMIPCDIDVNEFPALLKPNAPLKFQFKHGSTQYWGEVEVYNTRYPVVKVEFLQQNGQYVELSRRAYNYWTNGSGGFGVGPFTFRVTLADDTVIEAKEVEMVIPEGDDEGNEFSTGIQTIIKSGSTSSQNNPSSGQTDPTIPDNPPEKVKECSDSIVSQGYSCCEKDNCEVYYTDADGEWGFENNEWCGIPFSCHPDDPTIPDNPPEKVKECPDSIVSQGYSCCEKNNCEVYYTDADGEWGFENNGWCGIPFSCHPDDPNPSPTTCNEKFSQMGYECCTGCTVIEEDEEDPDLKWGIENDQWCGIRKDCV